MLYAKTIFIQKGGALKRLSHVTNHCCLLSQELAGFLPAKLLGTQHQLPCQPRPCRELGRASLFTSLHSSTTRFSTNTAGSHRREGELEHSHLGKKVNAPLPCEEEEVFTVSGKQGRNPSLQPLDLRINIFEVPLSFGVDTRRPSDVSDLCRLCELLRPVWGIK